jgi:hypothetical protein
VFSNLPPQRPAFHADVTARHVEEIDRQRGPKQAYSSLVSAIEHFASTNHERATQRYLERLLALLTERDVLGDLTCEWAQANRYRFDSKGITTADLQTVQNSPRYSALDRTLAGLLLEQLSRPRGISMGDAAREYMHFE